MTTRLLFQAVVLLFGVMTHTQSYAATHDRYVRFVMDESQLIQIQSGGVSGVELSTGFSHTFKPAQLTGVDMLNVHAQFFDQQGNQLYIVLRDLGGEFLNAWGHQWFQAAVGLDVGTVSGTFVNGWVFTNSVPRHSGNFACCTRTSDSQTVIESTGFGFDVTDSTIAIESMRFQFNFNNYSSPVVITDGGGFDRLSLKIRSEDIALVRKPISTSVEGPWDDAGASIDVDGNGRGSLGKTYDFGKIAVGYGGAQHYRYIVNVFPSTPNASDFAYPVFVADGFKLDHVGEENFDGCADGLCDGLSGNSNPACLATISDDKSKKGQIDGRSAVLEVLSSFTGQYCGFTVHVSTSVEGKGRNASYYPADCRTVLTAGGSISSLVKITNGIQVFDNVTQTLLPETLGQQLEPVGCP